MYQVTAKLAYRLPCVTTVVDYNLIINFFNIGDVKYPAGVRLNID